MSLVTDVYTLPAVAEYVVRESWDGTGAFDGPYDDVSDDVKGEPGVTVARGRDQGRGIGGAIVPRATWTLDNESRRYATEYSGSPIHNQLEPGRPCTIGAVIGGDVTMGDDVAAMGDPEALMGGAAEIPIFTGITEEPDESYGIGRRTVSVSALGLMRRLRGVAITIGYQASITTGAAMVLAYEAAGLTSDQYVVDEDVIDNGRHLLHYYVDGRDAWDVCREIWATEGPPAAQYEDAQGRVHFEGRNYRTLAERWQVVQAIYSDTDVSRESSTMGDALVTMGDQRVAMGGSGVSLFHTDVQYRPSYWSVINDMSIEVEQRAAQSVQQVWQASGPLVLAADETRELIARVTDPITSIQTPTVTTDFVLGAGSLASVTVTSLGPLAAKITLVAGASGATVNPSGSNTGIQLRASPVTVVSTVAAQPTVDASDSQAEFGVRGLPSGLSIWRGLSVEEAAGLCDGYLIAYPRPRSVITMTVENATGLLLREILEREIGDRIHVVDAWSGIDLDVTIEQISHAITSGGRHVAVFTCERVVELDWALWDVGRFDVDRFGQ